MAEPRQFSAVFTGNVAGAQQASDSATTVIAAAATPVLNGNTWATVGTPYQVVVNASDLEADHASGGARAYEISFHGRVRKLAGVEGDVNVHLYLNGAPMTNPTFRCISCNPLDPASEFTMFTSEQLVDGDTISVWLENADDDEDLQLVQGGTLRISS